MSNCEVHHLKPVFELEQHQVREVLRILLQSILFNRALGPVKPVERDSELFEVTWVRARRRRGGDCELGGQGVVPLRRPPAGPRPAGAGGPAHAQPTALPRHRWSAATQR